MKYSIVWLRKFKGFSHWGFILSNKLASIDSATDCQEFHIDLESWEVGQLLGGN